jgi:uncharacterized protein (TIRG00374 family)
MRFKNVVWFVVCAATVLAVYKITDATVFLHANVLYLAIAALLFLASTLFWAFAWMVLIRAPLGKTISINLKSLAGAFSPLSLGSDLLRAYFAKKERIDAAKALSASFVVKYFKFLIMFFCLLWAMALLIPRTPDVSQMALFFVSAVVMTVFGAVIVLALRMKPVARVFGRALNRVFVMRFHRALNRHFLELDLNKASAIILLLLISTLFEVAAVTMTFMAVDQWLPLAHIFIFSAVAHALTLVAVTPQGIGFVEGGGYLLLASGYFSLQKSVIGAFLIAWSLVRLWIPSAIGLLATWLGRR